MSGVFAIAGSRRPRETPADKWALFLRAVPGLWEQFAQVPAAYFSTDVEVVDGEQTRLATVHCPCGTDVIVETSAECAGTLSSGEPCKRFYLHLAGRVYVTNSPKRRKPRWVEIVDQWRAQSPPLTLEKR